MAKDNSPQALLPVTQADEDAADLLLIDCKLPEPYHSRAVQAFARHRISHSLPGDVGMLRAALTTARDYVAGSHDEGCELDPEFGEQNFDDEDDTRTWPGDRKCTCGTDEILANILAALTPSALSGDAGEGDGWLPIETAPKDGTRIIARFDESHGCRVDAVIFLTNRGGTKGWFSSHIMQHVQGERWMQRNQPTHWQPMPSAALPSHQGAGET